jgi:16S rRNA (uracil1498-N3)-methyltransferase
VSSKDWSGKVVVLSPEESHHAVKALRRGLGDDVTVTDGAGMIARCKVVGLEDARIRAEIRERRHLPAPSPAVVVYQGVPKGHKADVVVERLAEVGVGELKFFSSSRVVARWDGDKQTRLARRWEALARSAAKQSRNPYVMKTGNSLSWEELIDSVAEEQHAFTLWEESQQPLRAALPPRTHRVGLIIGPEGGLSAEEVERLSGVGAVPVSLGPVILRTEHAALVAASALLWHFGRIG